MKYFADNLKFLRKQKQLSQGQLAEFLNLNRGNIASYEKGIAEPSMTNLMNIVKYFNIEFRDLVETDLANRQAMRDELEKLGDAPIDGDSMDFNQQDLKKELIANKRKLENFVGQSDNMQKILDGFRQFHEYKMSNRDMEMSEEVKRMSDNYEELLDLMQTLLHLNQDIIQSIGQSEED